MQNLIKMKIKRIIKQVDNQRLTVEQATDKIASLIDKEFKNYNQSVIKKVWEK